MHEVDAVMGAGIGDEGQAERVAELLNDDAHPSYVVRCNNTGAMVADGATLILAHRFLVDPGQPVGSGSVLIAEDCNFLTPLDDFIGQLRYEALGHVVHGGRGNALGAALHRLKRLPGSTTTAGSFGNFNASVHNDYARHVARTTTEFKQLINEGRASAELVSMYERLIANGPELAQLWESWHAAAEVLFERISVLTHEQLSAVLRTERIVFTHPHGLLDQEDLPLLDCGVGDVVQLLNITGAKKRPVRTHYLYREEDEGLALRISADLARAVEGGGNIEEREAVVDTATDTAEA